jgi:hypothetical protein
MGGDQTISPWISIDSPSTMVPNSQVTFNTGELDYIDTFQYQLWLGNSTIRLPGKEYVTLT